MFIRIGCEITVECAAPTPMLLALQLHPSDTHRVIGSDRIGTAPETPVEDYVDLFGNRRTRLLARPGMTHLWSDCIVEDDGTPDAAHWQAHQHEIMDLPFDTLAYLPASRYCETDELVGTAWGLFGGTPPGWPRVQAIADHVHRTITFGYAFGRPTKTAIDVQREGSGVCRDFSHLFIALCRAMNIPARYASGYISSVGAMPDGPGDFCAWSEVFLDGRWYTFDARYNVPRIGRILMVRGRDAADAAMITAFGAYRLTWFKVWAERIADDVPERDFGAVLQKRPDTPALVYPLSSARLPA